MRVWTLHDRGEHTNLIKCDDYEIAVGFTRRDLLEFIVDACNQAERQLVPERDVEVDADLRQYEITRNGQTVTLSFADLQRIAASRGVDKE